MFGPGDKVLRREGVHECLLVVGSGIGRIDPVLTLEDVCFGICVPTGEDRIAGCVAARARVLPDQRDNEPCTQDEDAPVDQIQRPLLQNSRFTCLTAGSVASTQPVTPSSSRTWIHHSTTGSVSRRKSISCCAGQGSASMVRAPIRTKHVPSARYWRYSTPSPRA